MPLVRVPPERLGRWVDNFVARHGHTALAVTDGSLRGAAADGSSFAADPPFSGRYEGPADVGTFLGACVPPQDWGILLVRKGGFAVARVRGTAIADSKVGQRHVQGRTKAGGQSQQRFARRRDNQARVAYEAAADHAARILAGCTVLVAGGDEQALREVLKDPRLAGTGEPRGPVLPVPDPRRAVLEQAVSDACSVTIEVVNA
ncbi:acVLRF1 family peptidyl-tRNA hydrolase [Marmoricola sp. RAF53]|uniref:acVLRF1 family peptidyl-tRNA hydrolase n=1 Tax=Marmoricola sp. RAF53 TaxID=3233059 RepID=UPI003F958536